MAIRRLASLIPIACVLLSLAAQTQPPAADLSGNWHFILNAQDGAHEIESRLKVESGKVSGKWGASAVSGTFADGQFDLTFVFTYEQANISGQMHLKGKQAGDRLTGDWDFAGYNGDFAATRGK